MKVNRFTRKQGLYMKYLMAIFLTIILFQPTLAQTCKCDFTIAQDGAYDGIDMGVKPGQTICLAAGNYQYLYFKNVVGAALSPIKFINCGGKVSISSSTGQYGLIFMNSKYVKVTGSGNAGFKYGINISQTPIGTCGLVVAGFSTDFEIEKTEVSGTGFAGMMIKMDPTCDPATWRGNFTMYNIKVHDNYVHDTGAEGLYIGNSFWNSGMAKTCNGVNTLVYPHNIYGLTIYNNIVERTGADGIQFACAPNYLVYNNIIRDAGISPFEVYQNSGIQASGGVAGRLYNNSLQNVSGNGISFIGHSGTNITYNNLIVNVGGYGLYAINKAGTPAGNPFIVTSNTFVNSSMDGIRLDNAPDNISITNNAVFQPGSGKAVVTLRSMLIYQTANYCDSLLSVSITNKVIDSNYKPLAGSPLVDKGLLNSYWGIKTDLAGMTRPRGTTIDIGAYEYQPPAGARPGAELADLDVTVRQVTASPSPCIDEVLLKLSNQDRNMSNVTVYTADGRPVTYVAPDTPANEIRLKTSSLPTGTYLFKVVTTESETLNGRFIKL